MFPDESAAKDQAEQAYHNQSPTGATDQRVMGTAPPKVPSRLGYSLRDEAQKRAMHHHDQADKAQAAANFLAMHPEFEEFIRLIRSGSISI